MHTKTCLVTGASSGIGKEIATQLAKASAQVIIVCRNEAKGLLTLNEIKDKTANSSVELLIADLSSQADIKKLSQQIHNKFPHLNVLINNAGVVSSTKQFSKDGIELTLATNVLSPLLLSLELKDLLAKNSNPQIINVSSAIHKWAKVDLQDLQFEKRKYKFMQAYGQSKLLLNIITFALAKQFKQDRIRVNAIHPGAVKTALGSSNNHNFIVKALDKVIKYFFITPQKSAEAIVDLALSNKWQNVTGEYFEKGEPVSAKAICHNAELAKKVMQTIPQLLTTNSNS